MNPFGQTAKPDDLMIAGLIDEKHRLPYLNRHLSAQIKEVKCESNKKQGKLEKVLLDAVGQCMQCTPTVARNLKGKVLKAEGMCKTTVGRSCTKGCIALHCIALRCIKECKVEIDHLSPYFYSVEYPDSLRLQRYGN